MCCAALATTSDFPAIQFDKNTSLKAGVNKTGVAPAPTKALDFNSRIHQDKGTMLTFALASSTMQAL
jgi:hypothetical protein